MKRLILPVLLLLPVSAAIAATASAPARIPLDANRDGSVDRTEAAAHPKLAARFDRLDANRDGRLTPNERPRLHRRGHGMHGGIERLDADRDGRISRAEFDANGVAHGRDASRRLDFAAADTNRDGHLVRSEVRAHYERLRPQRQAEHRARSEQRFAEADLNRDGRLSRVEVDEKMPRVAGRFAWLDENRDGFLSRTELHPAPRR